jgi:hypothetical protein
VEVDPFAGGVSRKKKHPGRTLSVRIAVNFNPRDPANAILTHEDIEGFSAILRIISREPCIGRYSVVACSLYTRQVIYQQDGASQIDLPHLGKSLANLSLGRVSIDQLAMNGGESDFIAGLIAGNAGEDLPDAIILISSGSEIDLKLPRNVVNQLRGSRVFYLNYDARRDASSSGQPFPRGSPKTGHRGSLQNRPTIAITRDIDFDLRATTLSRCEQCLERGKQTTSNRIRAAGMVAAEDPEGHRRPARDGC